MNILARLRSDAPKLPWPPAAAIGVIGIAAALAAGQLAAAFVGPSSSPYVAVGDEVVNFTPGWLRQFAINNLGGNDKTVLFLTMGFVMLVFGIVAGLVSRRSAVPGTLFAIALGILGVLAVMNRSDLGQLGVISPIISLAAGALSFRLLHRLATEWSAARELAAASPAKARVAAKTGAAADAGRRRFLIGSAGVVLGAGVAELVGQGVAGAHNAEGSRAAIGALRPATTTAPLPVGADFASSGTPTYITNAPDFYRVDIALVVPQIAAEDWTLHIHGMVDRELNLRYSDIRKRPLVERIVSLTCVSNYVQGPYISNARWEGVLMRDLLKEAGVHPGAEQLLSTAVDGYTAGTPVSALMDDHDALLAIGMNGEPLPVEHGFPARIVVPGLYGYVSATKWVTDMELTTFSARQGYWVPRGYSQLAPIKTESRIDTPRAASQVPAGNVTIAGIAWAQFKGIARVEVRVDGGPWQDAQLSTEVTKNSWRMWRTTVTLRPGQHNVECRATDQSGYTQTQDRADEIPDGATGWPAVSFQAS